MKSILKLFLVGLAAMTLRADVLKLRDGRMFTGDFLGATRTEIWFKNDAPGDFLGARAYPIEQVESLTFGPAPKQSGQTPDREHAARNVNAPIPAPVQAPVHEGGVESR